MEIPSGAYQVGDYLYAGSVKLAHWDRFLEMAKQQATSARAGGS